MALVLADLLHEVPRLWDFLDNWDKQSLWATSHELRRQSSELVSSIEPDSRAFCRPHLPIDISRLVRCTWTHLHSLELTLDPALVPELSTAACPLLKRLVLTQTSSSPREQPAELDEHIFDGFKGKWPLLERLAITLGKLTTVHITALVEADWTLLKSLRIEPLDRALPDLMHGNWPQLTNLSLGVGLTEGGLEPLSACPWSTLERLELVRCNLDVRSMAGLVQADLRQLKELSLRRVAVSNTQACCSQLACGRWPLLAVLTLALIDDRSSGLVCDVLPQGLKPLHFMEPYAERVKQPNDVLALTLGKWPCLQSLTIDNFPMGGEDIYDLLQAAWPELIFLSMIGF